MSNVVAPLDTKLGPRYIEYNPTGDSFRKSKTTHTKFTKCEKDEEYEQREFVLFIHLTDDKQRVRLNFPLHNKGTRKEENVLDLKCFKQQGYRLKFTPFCFNFMVDKLLNGQKYILHTYILISPSYTQLSRQSDYQTGENTNNNSIL